MPLNLKKTATEHDDLSFFKTLYHASVKDIMEMDSPRIQSLMTKMEALGCWLEGIHKLTLTLNKKENRSMTRPTHKTTSDQEGEVVEILFSQSVKDLLGIDETATHVFIGEEGIVHVRFKDIEEFFEELKQKGRSS